MNAREPLTFHVATNGNDQWSGRLAEPDAGGTDGPFATLVGARDAIRRLRLEQGLCQPIDVLVRGGTHRMSEPLRLSGGDSGTATCPIRYRAWPGETPVLNGGRRITGWKPFRGPIVCAELPEVLAGRWWFRQLFWNGRRLIRARQPKHDRQDPLYGGWAFVEAAVPVSDVLEGTEKLDLPLEWKFRTDPQRAGEARKWFAADWPDADWTTLRIDQAWTMQGHKEYHGVAWYRLRFRVPEGFDTRAHLWLNFGAVDKEAAVYIDGRIAFEHTEAATQRPPEQLWNEPFKFDARPFLVPGRDHVIAVKVTSERHAGGIYRPVSLVSADVDVPPALLAGIVETPTAFRHAPGVFPRAWAKPTQGDVFVIPGSGWISDIIPIRKVDAARRIIYLARAVGPSRHTLGTATHIATGNRFYVENMLEDLTEPGEWCLDADAGMLYLWPPEGDAESAEVSAPVTDRLVQMIGTADCPVRHVSLEGFTLTQTLARFPTPDAYYKTPNAGQALYMENTEDCTIADNRFHAVGGDAIRLQNANARDRIVGNEIAEAGAYGIFLGSFQRGFARHDTVSGDSPSPTEWHRDTMDQEVVVKAWPRTKHHLIANNHIHHIGLFEKHAAGIAFFGVSAVDVVVAHNWIHHGPRFGIGLMSGFGRVLIEYNDLHDLSLETADTGGITANRWYTWAHDADLCRGNVIRFNRIRDVWGCGAHAGPKIEKGGGARAGGRILVPYFSWAIYFDNAPMDVLVYGNICARNTLGGIMISHYARNVTIENNIFVNGSQWQVYLLIGGVMSNIRLRRNIVAYAGPDAETMALQAYGASTELTVLLAECDGNLYHLPAGKSLSFSGLTPATAAQLGLPMHQATAETLDAWRRLGYDRASVFADPRFVDPANDHYDLAPDSPAHRLGFVPIDAGRIGLEPAYRARSGANGG